jgi:hypothetical protein
MALPINHTAVIGLPLRQPIISRSLGLLRKQGAALRPAAAMFHEHLSSALRRKKQLA